MIMVMDLLLPAVFRVIDSLMCVMDLFQPDGWEEQLDCIEDSCYPDGSTSTAAWWPFAVVDGFQTFTSIPNLWNKIVHITERVTNKATGQAYDTTSAGSFIVTSTTERTSPLGCVACRSSHLVPTSPSTRFDGPSRPWSGLAPPGLVAPYQLHLEESGALIFAPEDSRACVRATRLQRLRFAVGDAVECNLGERWAKGVVVDLMLTRDAAMASGVVAPYQVQLEGGGLIYAPEDAEGTIRKPRPLWRPPMALF